MGDVERNGPLASGSKKETGYDLAKYIRNFMEAKDYNRFSVAEVMCTAKYPGVGKAKAFLSHAQAELCVLTTANLFKAAGYAAGDGDRSKRTTIPVFVDYFCLRQCRNDFNPSMVRRAIKRINFTIACMTLAQDGVSVEMMSRVWCGFEIYCTTKDKVRFWAVFAKSSDLEGCDMQLMIPESATSFRFQDCESSKPNDKGILMEYIESLPGGVEAANQAVSQACVDVRNFQNANEDALFSIAFALCCGCGVAIALVSCAVTLGWGVATGVLTGILALLCLMYICCLLRMCAIEERATQGVRIRLSKPLTAPTKIGAASYGCKNDTPSHTEEGHSQLNVH